MSRTTVAEPARRAEPERRTSRGGPDTSTTTAPGASPARALPLPRPRRRQWWTDAVGLAVWASLLVVVVLWERNGGIQDLAGGLAPALTSLGRVTGLLSANLLLLQLFAIARVPWVERAVGQDRMLRWHRLAGFSSIWLLLAHIVLVSAGYAAYDGAALLGTFWDLVATAPGMLLALAGTVALVGVAVTSMRAARRRVRYESWHLLHLYAYLGAGLALPHQLWTGADFNASPVATAYWWSVYGLAVGAVLLFRVVMPLVRSWRHRLTVSQVTQEGPGVVSVVMTGRHLDRLRVAPGQFFVWRFRTGPGWTRGHPLSLSAAPTTEGLRVTIGTNGDDGARLAAMTPGTQVLVEGPYGRLVSDVRVRPRLAVLAAGVGIAPLLALLEENARTPDDAPAILVHRVKHEALLVLGADIDRLVRTAGLQVVALVGEPGPTGTRWLPEHYAHVAGPLALRQMIPDLDQRDVFVCGPGPWADAVVDDLREDGVARDAVHLETFDW